MADLVSLIAEVLADTDPEWVGEGVCETATWARRAAELLVDRLNLHQDAQPSIHTRGGLKVPQEPTESHYGAFQCTDSNERGGP